MLINAMPEQEHLCDITENVWTGFLEIPLSRAEGTPPVCDCAASIRIEGAWNGSVVVACSRGLAQRLAEAMFLADDQEVREALRADALCEIANIIGGNVKSLLPSPSRLGLPRYHTGWHPPVGAMPVAFSSDGEPLHVFLIEGGA